MLSKIVIFAFAVSHTLAFLFVVRHLATITIPLLELQSPNPMPHSMFFTSVYVLMNQISHTPFFPAPLKDYELSMFIANMWFFSFLLFTCMFVMAGIALIFSNRLAHRIFLVTIAVMCLVRVTCQAIFWDSILISDSLWGDLIYGISLVMILIALKKENPGR